jgi:hypothetical protein
MLTDFDDDNDRHGLPLEWISGTPQEHRNTGTELEHWNPEAELELMAGAQPMRTQQLGR